MGRLYNPINYPQSWPYLPLQCFSPSFHTAFEQTENRETMVRERVPGSPSYQHSHTQGASERIFSFPWQGYGPEVAFQAEKDFLGYSEIRTLTQDEINNPDISITAVTMTNQLFDDVPFAVNRGYGRGTYPNIFTFTANNDFAIGDIVVISGVSPSGFNGVYTVLGATSTTFAIYSYLDNPTDTVIYAPFAPPGWNLTGATVSRHPSYIHRRIPHTNPSMPGYLYATNVRIEPSVPLGKDTRGVAVHDEGDARVTYASPLYRILTDDQLKRIVGGLSPNESSLLRYCQMQLDPKAKFQTIPAMAAFTWQSEPRTPVAQQAYVTLAEGDLTVQWLGVPYAAYPRTAISKCLGKSNAYDFGHEKSFYGTFPRGTLVMLVPKIDNIRMNNGDFGFNITYRFQYFPQGANALFRFPNTPSGQLAPNNANELLDALRPRFDFISTNGRPSGYPFPPVDFAQLFMPEP